MTKKLKMKSKTVFGYLRWSMTQINKGRVKGSIFMVNILELNLAPAKMMIKIQQLAGRVK